MALLTRLVLAVTIVTFATCSSACLRTCRFKLCRPSKISLRSRSDVPVTSAICLSDRPVGVVNTGESRVQDGPGKYTPISRLNLRGLRRKFSQHFFKSYALKPTREMRNRGSGVGHEVPQENQKNFLGGRCVALPINEYQKLSEGMVVKNIRLRGRPLVDCVSFMVERKRRFDTRRAYPLMEEPLAEVSAEPTVEPSGEPMTM